MPLYGKKEQFIASEAKKAEVLPQNTPQSKETGVVKNSQKAKENAPKETKTQKSSTTTEKKKGDTKKDSNTKSK